MIPIPDTRHEDIRSQIASLGILQGDDPILREQARRLALPDEVDLVKSVLDELLSTIRQLRGIHRFTNGVGLAAPQIGRSLSIAVVRPIGNYPVRLINPRIVSVSSETDIQYEGCLSFFDYRGLVRRPRSLVVECADLRGRVIQREYHGAVARLVAHEVDHLNGRLYVDLIGHERDLVDVSVYNSRRWGN
jgi:peptide deformylase